MHAKKFNVVLKKTINNNLILNSGRYIFLNVWTQTLTGINITHQGKGLSNN